MLNVILNYHAVGLCSSNNSAKICIGLVIPFFDRNICGGHEFALYNNSI